MPAAQPKRQVIPFKLWHLSAIDPQYGQESSTHAMGQKFTDESQLGESYTLVRDDRIMMIAGIMEIEPGRGLGWSVVSQYANCYDMIQMRRQLDKMIGRFDTVEVQFADVFTRGHRLMKLLGFVKRSVVELWGEPIADYVRLGHAV